MRETPAAAWSFVIGMILLSILTSYGFLYSILSYTDTGLLIYKSAISAPSPSTDRADRPMFRCTYFTGTRLFQREVTALAADQAGAALKAGCPWRIDLS